MSTLINKENIMESFGWGEVFLCTAPLPGDIRPRQYLYSHANIDDVDCRLFAWCEGGDISIMIEDYTNGGIIFEDDEFISSDELKSSVLWGWVPPCQPGQRSFESLLLSNVMKHLVEDNSIVQGD